ncbi:hypothetical protein FHW12_004063 [Dokdonella fugitiva]|uniref:Uncharacterized protein n=1 Tax=Dokdonella fugitiva TaxID=328517 RepID=A0A839F5G4_9GAMM|nr:hypothetical protein [Dokdonella fugitiva]MBA8889816.1 hypothetical protein [Dokdonella fugitiva]
MLSLGLGYIGLDFENPPGDLTDVSRESIPQDQRDYWDFAHEMAIGDIVLIIAHHHPTALVRVVGEYNYVREPEAAIGAWFRHFRKIEVLGHYADLVTNPKDWEKLTMTDTISVLNDRAGISWQLIDRWLQDPTVKEDSDLG